MYRFVYALVGRHLLTHRMGAAYNCSMESTHPFLDHLAEVIQDEITVAGAHADLLLEARSNQWSFSMTQEQASRILPHQIIDFITQIMAVREEAIVQRYGSAHPMIFYTWFDDQAVQLRFSLVSAQHTVLPFKCRIRRVTDLTPIVEQFLQSPYHDGLTDTEIEPTRDESRQDTEETQESHSVLDVWTVQLPRG